MIKFSGLPVPLTQATTMAIFGISATKNGLNLWKSDTVKQIIKIWITSPVSSMVVSYFLVQTVIDQNIYAAIIILSAFFMGMGYMSFLKPSLKRNQDSYKD